MTELLGRNNRQAVSDFIASSNSPDCPEPADIDQLKPTDAVAEQSAVYPMPQLRPATERSLLPAEHNTLLESNGDQTGRRRSTKLIWQSISFELSGVKAGELIPWFPIW